MDDDEKERSAARLRKAKEDTIRQYLKNGGNPEDLKGLLMEAFAKSEEGDSDLSSMLSRQEELNFVFGGVENFITSVGVMTATEGAFAAIGQALSDAPPEETDHWTVDAVAFGLVLNLGLLLRHFEIPASKYIEMASRVGLALDAFESDMGRIGKSPFKGEA